MDENVTDCPLSIVGLEGLIDGVDKVGFTIKLLVYPDVTVVGCESVSTTLACNGEFEGNKEFVVIVLLHVVPLVIIVFTSMSVPDVTVVGCESVSTTLACNGEFEGNKEFVVIVLLHVVPLVIIVFTSIYLLGVMAFATNTLTVYGAVPPDITPLKVID